MSSNQMNEENLYIEMDRYTWSLKKESRLVPPDQVWVVYESDHPRVVPGAKDGPQQNLPSSIFLIGTPIYKFLKSAQDSWELQLFEGSGLELEIKLTIFTTIINPISYIDTLCSPNVSDQERDKALRVSVRG